MFFVRIEIRNYAKLCNNIILLLSFSYKNNIYCLLNRRMNIMNNNFDLNIFSIFILPILQSMM